MFRLKVRIMGLPMCYSECIKQKEGIIMETTFYTFNANEIVVTGSGVEQVSGGQGRRMVYLRHSAPKAAAPAAGKVIDFEAWRSCHEDTETEPDFCVEDAALFMDAENTCDAPAATAASPRRASHGMYLDWLASVALIAVAVSACVSFLI